MKPSHLLGVGQFDDQCPTNFSLSRKPRQAKACRTSNWPTTHLLALALTAVFVSGCALACSTRAGNGRGRLTDDERHRLYSAALAASETPLDNDTFKQVCREIGIFDAQGRPNDQYMSFVSQHVNWGVRPDSEQFRREIDSKEKASEYIAKHLPAP